MGNSKRSNRNSPACGLGSRTAGVVSISRRPRRAQRVHSRRNQGTFGREREPTSRPIPPARPSIGTPLEAEDAMDLARLIRMSFFEGMPQWGLVHLAEAATEERRPAGGMVLHQSDRPRAIHFLVAGSMQILLRSGRPAGGSGQGRWLGDRRPTAGCRRCCGRRLRGPRWGLPGGGGCRPVPAGAGDARVPPGAQDSPCGRGRVVVTAAFRRVGAGWGGLAGQQHQGGQHGQGQQARGGDREGAQDR
jgi:hypothetical protein